MAQRTANAAQTSTAPAAPPSAWVALRYPVFRSLWIATVVSNVGSWMYNAASGWLMTSLTPSPLIVSLVQVANSLPLFLFALPAGALADTLDKRRLILALEILTTLLSAVFALLVTLHAVNATLLLLSIFVLGILAALETPAWQAIVPQLVPDSALSSAVAVNSVGINISRVIGPAITGYIIVGLGVAAPFWLDAFSNGGVIGVIFRWRPPPRTTLRPLPAERLSGAIRAGVRYARYNRALRATLARAVGFFFFASAYWALLPLVARNQLQGGPALYGTLLAAIGAGAVVGALFLPRMQARMGADGVVVLGQAGTAAALVLFGLAHQPWVAALACLLAGISWIVVLAILNVSAQIVLPDWVRGRGLAVYVTVFFGTMTLGSAFWGLTAEQSGLGPAHYLAGGGALIALWVTRRWKLHVEPAVDLTPSMHWPPPVLADGLDKDAGPVLVTIEYHVDAANREAFLAALVPLAYERQRDGAYDWNVFQDTEHPERMIETFLSDSWLDHLRQHGRVTRADQAAEDEVRRLVRAPPRIAHYIAARPQRGAD
jgi:MFS family permease